MTDITALIERVNGHQCAATCPCADGVGAYCSRCDSDCGCGCAYTDEEIATWP